MKRFVIQKQLIPLDVNTGDDGWAKRQIWVLRLNQSDTIDEFDTIEEAVEKKNELIQNDPTARVYKIVEVVDGNYVDVNI
jgi:hypothetical protein